MPRLTPSAFAALMLAASAMVAPAVAQPQLALMPSGSDCPFSDPDPVQISWNSPCEQGNWLYDPQNGCRMWDWHREPNDRAVWNGACARGIKEGRGVTQWYEHGQPIDRFEGTYRDGKRQGFGRYVWSATDRFEGQYRDDVPDGPGTATLAGEVFSGQWKQGCMRKGSRVVAIGVPRKSCAGVPTASLPQP